MSERCTISMPLTGPLGPKRTGTLTLMLEVLMLVCVSLCSSPAACLGKSLRLSGPQLPRLISGASWWPVCLLVLL